MITARNIVDFLEDVVANEHLKDKHNPREIPDFSACLYQDGKGNHCIVGHWLALNFNIDDEWMDENIEGKPADSAIEIATDEGLIDENMTFQSIEILTDLQQCADHINADGSYTTWGEAAKEILNRIDINEIEQKERGW